MTRAELIVAARVARTYPAGAGMNWGYGPLERCFTAEDAAEAISQEPWLSRYG